MKQTPLVSLIIPVYNREEYIVQSIESAINQTYSNIEIIIGDNCSTDATWAIVKQYAKYDKRIIAFQNQENIGPVRNWWACIERARGEYFKIIFSDDWISLDFVAQAVNAFDPDVAFIVSKLQLVRDEESIEGGFWSFRYNRYTTHQFLDDIFLWHHYGFSRTPSPGYALFRTEDVRECFVIDIPNKNNLDSCINGAGNDMLLFLNIASLSRYRYIKTNCGVSYFRAHGGSFSCSNTSLTIFYDWCKIFFLRNHNFLIYTDVLKFRFLIKSIRDHRYNYVCRALSFSRMCIVSLGIYVCTVVFKISRNKFMDRYIYGIK